MKRSWKVTENHFHYSVSSSREDSVDILSNLEQVRRGRGMKFNPYDAHCCHMGAATLTLSPERASECLDVKNYKWRLNPVWHGMLYSSCTYMATVGIKGLIGLIERCFVCPLTPSHVVVVVDALCRALGVALRPIAARLHWALYQPVASRSICTATLPAISVQPVLLPIHQSRRRVQPNRRLVSWAITVIIIIIIITLSLTAVLDQLNGVVAISMTSSPGLRIDRHWWVDSYLFPPVEAKFSVKLIKQTNLEWVKIVKPKKLWNL